MIGQQETTTSKSSTNIFTNIYKESANYIFLKNNLPCLVLVCVLTTDYQTNVNAI